MTHTTHHDGCECYRDRILDDVIAMILRDRSERIARLGSDDIMDYEYSAESRAMAYIARRVSEMKHGYTAGRITTKADNAAQCLPIGPDTNETPHLDAND